MRKFLPVVIAVAIVGIPLVISQSPQRGFAQVVGPQGDEFNNDVFAAPFKLICGQQEPACPNPQGPMTWSLNSGGSGVLRIWTQFGSLLGTAAQSSNNARNLVL